MVGSAPATPTATALLAAHRRRHHDGSAARSSGRDGRSGGRGNLAGSNAALHDDETSRLHPPNFVKTSGDGPVYGIVLSYSLRPFVRISVLPAAIGSVMRLPLIDL
jgi:hypothetical protein